MILKLLLLSISLYYQSKRVKYYLQILQQEDYEIPRFMAWCKKHYALDLSGFGISLLCIIKPYLGLTVFIIWSKILKDPKTRGKLPLNITPRLKRIYNTYLVLYFITCFILIYIGIAGLSVSIILSPLILSLSVKLLENDEKQKQADFIDQAYHKMQKINPYTVGITGSYGKTSVKHILGPVLQVSLGDTLWTSGGINTIMGITQQIRERFFLGLKFCVVEMGAYRQGSIKKVCDLVRPQAAIITAVGECHLERFKTQESIFEAKSELAKAVPIEGILVVNGDNKGARKIGELNHKNITLFYGLHKNNNHLDCYYEEYYYDKYGIRFIINFKGESYPGYTKMLGEAALSNILAAFTMSVALGSEPLYALGVISHLQAYSNRLKLEITSDVVFLHDAYNSNPEGFTSALDVLGKLECQGKRILMTPGMVELGDHQYKSNLDIAVKASRICDYIIFVGQTNKLAWEQGLIGFKGKIIYCIHRDLAFEEFHRIRSKGDLLLIENDLTDIYETPWRF